MKRLTRREVALAGAQCGCRTRRSALLPLEGCFHRHRDDVPSTQVLAPGLTAIGEGSLKSHATNANILTGAPGYSCACAPTIAIAGCGGAVQYRLAGECNEVAGACGPSMGIFESPMRISTSTTARRMI